jgi:hypothetical protein
MAQGILISELVGKMVLVRSRGGVGTKGPMLSGDYKGLLLGADDEFLKLEYEVSKFVEGKNVITKEIVLIDLKYVITVEEYKETTEF